MEGILIKFTKIIVLTVVLALVSNICVFAVTDTSASSVVLNADTLEIIYQNNPYTKRSMASTTKIMTALLLAESGRLDEIIRCSAEMVTVEGSAMGLKAGDYISARDLMYGILLMSGNDAANVCAYFLSGSLERFAELMNNKAREIGLDSTSFVTPSGLDAEEHYTTAYDLAVLTSYALKNEEFANACKSSSATVRFGDPMVKYTITNHNRLLKSYNGCIGVKTGFTKKSGRCLVSAATREGATVIAVTLNDPNDWRDHASLLDYGFESMSKSEISCKTNITTDIIGGLQDTVSLEFEDMTVYSLSENSDKLILKISIPEYVFAPIYEGEVIGTASVVFEGRTVAVTNICSRNTVKVGKPGRKTFKEEVKEFIILMLKSF